MHAEAGPGGEPNGKPTTDPFALAASAAEVLAQRTGAARHDVAVVLGTGLAPAAAYLGAVGEPQELAGIPGFLPCTGLGHRAAAWSCTAGGRRVLVFAGRVHLYEGRSPAEIAHPVRTAVAAGCDTVILTCAVGGIRPGLGVGSLALIADHLNLTGRSPLTGVPAAHRPSPFVDLTDVWSRELRELARRHDPTLEELVLAQVPGPNLETPAEIKMMASMGADLVGMSTALEAIAVHHLGARVLGVAVVTNPAAGVVAGPIHPDHIQAAAATAAERLGRLLHAVAGGPPA